MSDKLFDLGGRMILVTGSYQGLGFSIASEVSNFVNGQVVYVDGGLLSQM